MHHGSIHACHSCCCCSASRSAACCCLACRDPRGIGFVEFQDERDAADAVRGLDGMMLGGREVRNSPSSSETPCSTCSRSTCASVAAAAAHAKCSSAAASGMARALGATAGHRSGCGEMGVLAGTPLPAARAGAAAVAACTRVSSGFNGSCGRETTSRG